jgi:hypothetical protein
MDKSAIRLFALGIGASALAVVSTVVPAEARTGHGHHIKQHARMSRGLDGLRPAERSWSGASPVHRSGEVCPGIARSFDCKIWPPPIDEDPDRKISGSDGG